MRDDNVASLMMAMKRRGTYLRVDWGVDSRRWEVQFIFEGVRYEGISRRLATALRAADAQTHKESLKEKVAA